jgi:hypothetical protein
MIIGPWYRPRGVRVAHRSVGEIRVMAQNARRELGITGARINMVRLLEFVLPGSGIHYHVVEPADIPDEVARAEPETGRILLTIQAYNALHANDPSYELLIPHEFAHLALQHSITFARLAARDAHTALEDSEVQADVFSHEFSMPWQIVQRHCRSVDDIVREFNVPKQDARIRAQVLRQDSIISWG